MRHLANCFFGHLAEKRRELVATLSPAPFAFIQHINTVLDICLGVLEEKEISTLRKLRGREEMESCTRWLHAHATTRSHLHPGAFVAQQRGMADLEMIKNMGVFLSLYTRPCDSHNDTRTSHTDGGFEHGKLQSKNLHVGTRHPARDRLNIRNNLAKTPSLSSARPIELFKLFNSHGSFFRCVPRQKRDRPPFDNQNFPVAGSCFVSQLCSLHLRLSLPYRASAMNPNRHSREI